MSAAFEGRISQLDAAMRKWTGKTSGGGTSQGETAVHSMRMDKLQAALTTVQQNTEECKRNLGTLLASLETIS